MLKNESHMLRNKFYEYRIESQVLINELRILRNKIQALSNELQTLRSESQKTDESLKTNKLRGFNKELHRKMINTTKKFLIEFVDKRHKVVFFDKDEIILKQTQVKKHNKDTTENVSRIKIRRNIIMLKLVQLTNVHCKRKHIEEKKFNNHS